MKTKKKSGKTLRKSGKSQGKIREFDGIKKVGTLCLAKYNETNNTSDPCLGVFSFFPGKFHSGSVSYSPATSTVNLSRLFIDLKCRKTTSGLKKGLVQVLVINGEIK